MSSKIEFLKVFPSINPAPFMSMIWVLNVKLIKSERKLEMTYETPFGLNKKDEKELLAILKKEYNLKEVVLVGKKSVPEIKVEMREEKPKEKPRYNAGEKTDGEIIKGKMIRCDKTDSIKSIDEASGIVVIDGEIFDIEISETKSGRIIFTFDMTDEESSIMVKMILKADDANEYKEKIKKGMRVRVKGEARYDTYYRGVLIFPFDIMKLKDLPPKMDLSTEKRVELHLHTKMSAMDSVVDIDKVYHYSVKNVCLDDINFVKAKKYTQSSIDVSSNKIAVIYAQGDVVQGKGTGVNVYSSVIAKALDDAADNDAVKAIVLRVNSPGGAVVASEIMTNAVIRAKQKKPIVVSMSDVAASAGYEISCNATKIVAMPTTITGSIGVFGIYPQVGRMLKNKLGITTDTILTNRNAAALSINRPLSAESHNMLVRNVEDFYKTFCQRVAKGRNLSVEYVDSIARGRVWTGIQAKELGLVDELGGIDVALRIAAQEAGITNYSIVAYPKQKDAVTELMEMLNTEALEAHLQNQSIAKYYKQMEQISNMEPLQARLPYFIEF